MTCRVQATHTEPINFREFTITRFNLPFIMLNPSSKNDREHGILIFYGGTMAAGFRNIVCSSLGYVLAQAGFTVYCFDFRSNIWGKDYADFGLHDRLEDAREVFGWLKSKELVPLSILGVSMGGPLAVTVAAENGTTVSNLFLVAPAAYHPDACRPDVKFGPALSEIIRRPDRWRESPAFKLAEMVTADTLIFGFRDEEVIPFGVIWRYFNGFKNHRMSGKPTRQKVEILPGGHRGSFSDKERIELIASSVSKFVDLRSYRIM